MIDDLRKALLQVNTTKQELEKTTDSTTRRSKKRGAYDDAIYQALNNISQSLGTSYKQACIDIKDSTRLSWVGAATELREVLRCVLDNLAPDDTVKGQPGFIYEPDLADKKQVSQRQKARYILKQRNAGSTEIKLAENVEHVENQTAAMVRQLYSRASVSTHVLEKQDDPAKAQSEARIILKYFEAFAHDLLNIR